MSALAFMEPRRPPALSPLAPEAWVACDPDYAAQMARRDRLIGTPGAALALEEAAPALAEFREALLAHLAGREGWRIGRAEAERPDEARVSLALDPLRLAGRLTQEDWLLLTPDAPEPRLVAGMLLFPSRWRLSEKLGRPLTAIHAPVPGYAGDLAARTLRVMTALRPERPLVRANWQVHGLERLDQPLGEGEPSPAPDPSGGLWLRTERQSLARLPRTGAIVFGVKTSAAPLAALGAAERRALHAALRELSEAEVVYRGGAGVRDAALAALGDDL